MLSTTISQKSCWTSYGCFRPNKYDPHLWRRCYRGGWHRSYPPLILQAVWTWQKPYPKVKHLESPYHTFVHCKVFATAASLRTRTLFSVSFSGLELSLPLLIFGLVSHYLTNNLISRRLILWHCFSRKVRSSLNPLFGVSLNFSRLSQTIS